MTSGEDCRLLMFQLLVLQPLMKTAGVEVQSVAVDDWWTGDEKEC